MELVNISYNEIEPEATWKTGVPQRTIQAYNDRIDYTFGEYQIENKELFAYANGGNSFYAKFEETNIKKGEIYISAETNIGTKIYRGYTKNDWPRCTGIILNNLGPAAEIKTINVTIKQDNWIADIFTTTTTAVTEFTESVSTSVSAVGGMFYQGGQMTFLGTLSLLTAGTLLVMWAVRTIRRLIGR